MYYIINSLNTMFKCISAEPQKGQSITMSLPIVIEFSGGAELLFKNVKSHNVTLPDVGKQWTIRSLLVWIKDNLLQERPEFFVQGDTVRPGILVLINDTDWELLGELDYVIKKDDKVIFISTLHGG